MPSMARIQRGFWGILDDILFMIYVDTFNLRISRRRSGSGGSETVDHKCHTFLESSGSAQVIYDEK